MTLALVKTKSKNSIEEEVVLVKGEGHDEVSWEPGEVDLGGDRDVVDPVL